LTYRKKLIEVALPLDKINAESAREKSIRHGHPSKLHLWWARRPLAACRAVLFSSIVDDPGEPAAPAELLERIDRLPVPERLRPTWGDLPVEEQRRQRLFAFIEELVKWESTNDERVLTEARALVRAATGGKPPPVLDPFCGGGSIPLEAQRLGLEAHGSDLNPVAVLITKALIEIPPKFSGSPPVNPEARKQIGSESNWRGASGLAEDVRYYGAWMRDEAKKRIGHLYPKGPEAETVIAWLWARTVRCPNPVCGAEMPLVSSFWLSKKANKKAWVEPVVEGKTVRFEVKNGSGESPDPPKIGRGMGQQLMAVVAEGERGRKYLPATEDHITAAEKAQPEWGPEQELPGNARWFSPPIYGLTTYTDLFTSRQLVALNTFSDFVQKAREKVRGHALSAGLPDDSIPLNNGGAGAQAYADAVATYLGLALSRLSDLSSTICPWSSNPAHELVVHMFTRQAIPMVWDFGEINPFSQAASWEKCLSFVPKVLEKLVRFPQSNSIVAQTDATSDSLTRSGSYVIATDPPYYDNVGYADLSDYFYVWLRRSLNKIYPDIFSTMLVPKSRELVATPYRFGGSKQKAQEFFEEGLIDLCEDC
jgi:putative DNA methylase